ncbi:MAG TPA: acyl-CoA thioesterase domain-containing protein [Mycobacteriales bacterium]|nr:acyl-CoA thioesterase domain-containing protein [Mycobacteriales bacterium]
MTDRRTFLTRSGDRFVPNAAAVGPWGPTTVSGLVVAGLVGYGAEQAGGDADFVGTRLTVDMVRMATMDELRVESSVLREGRRLRMVDVTITQGGRNVAHGRAVFARRSKPPTGDVWSPAVTMPAPPAPEETPLFGPKPYVGRLAQPAADFEPWRDASQEKFVWYDFDAQLVDGEPTSPFVRAAAVADVANPLTNWGSEGLQFVNSDVTLLLSREPQGTMLGMAARDRQEADGVSVGSAVMVDRFGPVGIATVVGLASEVEMRPPHHGSAVQ